MGMSSSGTYELLGNGKVAAQFITKDDTVQLIQKDGKNITIGKYTVDKDFAIKAELDLDRGKVKVYAQGKYTTFYGKIQYVNVRVFAFNIYVYLCKQFFIIKDFFANIKKRLFDIYQFINKFSNKFTNGYKSRV